MFKSLAAAVGAALVACVSLGGLAGSSPAAAAGPGVEVYGRLPYIFEDQFKLSPSGAMIAFVARGEGGTARHLVVRELATGRTVVDAPFSQAKIRELEWAGEDFLLVTTSQTLNNLSSGRTAEAELYQAVSINLKTGFTQLLLSKEKKIYPAVFGIYGVIQRDGKWYAYVRGLTLQGTGTAASDFDQQQFSIGTGSTYDLYEVDLELGNPHRVAQGGRYVAGWAVDSQGKILAISNYDEQTGRWRLNGADGRLELMSVDSPMHQTGLAGPGRTPRTVLVASNDPDVAGLTEINVDNRNQTTLLGDQSTLELLHGQNNVLIGAQVEGDRRRSVFFDSAVQAAYDKASKPFRNLTVRFVSADAAWKKWILHTEGDGDSGTFWLVDLNTRKAEQVASSYPDIAPESVGASRIVTWKAQDGTDLQGVLTLPVGRQAKSLPLVVLPHGGPQSRDTLAFDWMAQAFAARGYAVFQPNFRGSSGFTVEFLRAGLGQWGRKMQTDISDGVAELGRQGIVDPKRACIVGASYGGYAALAGVTIQHGLYLCAVSYGGLSDLSLLMRDDKGLNASFRSWKAFLGANSGGDPVVKQYSPRAQAAKADAPILLVHGQQDTVVPILQSRVMADELKDKGKAVEYVELPGDHWLSDEPTRQGLITAAVAFVEKHNPAN